MKLYKYKSASTNNDGKNYDIENLLNDSLWISTLDKMNDPLEMGFYIDKDVDLSEVASFQLWLLQQFSCISFSTTKICRRLWNYYTDGMKGMTIEYTDTTVRKALEAIDISTIKVDEMIPKKPLKCTNLATEGRVIYDGRKINLSEWYKAFIGENASPGFLPNTVPFHKDNSWADEKEYRFAFDKTFTPKDCLLKNMVPTGIYIGYRMPSTNTDILCEYCKGKKIPLYRYTPDFHSPSSKQYFKDIIYDPNGLSDSETEITE